MIVYHIRNNAMPHSARDAVLRSAMLDAVLVQMFLAAASSDTPKHRAAVVTTKQLPTINQQAPPLKPTQTMLIAPEPVMCLPQANLQK